MDNIRIISDGGKYSLRHCDIDDEGNVEYVRDKVDIKASCFKEFSDILDGIVNARRFSCIILNSGNKKEYLREG